MSIRGDGYVVERKARKRSGKKTKATGRWQIRLPYPGGQIDRCGGTKKQAQIKHRRLLMCRDQGMTRAEALSKVFGDAGADAHAFRDIASAYLAAAESEKGAQTVFQERNRAETLSKSRLGSVPLARITRSMVQDYLRSRIKARVEERKRSLPADLSPKKREQDIERFRFGAQRTANRFLSLLASVCKYAEDEGVLPDGFWISLGLRGYSEKGGYRGIHLTVDEIGAVAAAMPPWLADFVHLAANTGLRRGAVCGLTWGNVDLVARTVIVERELSKSRRALVLPMPLSVYGLLRRLKDERGDVEPDAPVFLNSLGRPVLGQTAYAAYKRVLRKGVPGVPEAKTRRLRIHDLRHSSAWIALGGESGGVDGASIMQVRDMLGHANVTTTEQYLPHVRPPATEAANAIDRAHAAARARRGG